MKKSKPMSSNNGKTPNSVFPKGLENVDLSECTGIADAVELAIKKEDEATVFFYDKEQNVTTPALKNIFLYLAQEEEKHKQFLKNFKEKIDTSSCPTPSSFIDKIERNIYNDDFSLEDSFLGVPETELRTLMAAMELEKKAEEFYLHLVAKSPNESLKRFFTFLAKIEKKHYDLLDDFLDKTMDKVLSEG